MKTHELKVWPEFFEALADGSKPFEVRRDDRGYEVGDWLHLREWIKPSRDEIDGTYTGREVHRQVTYILSSRLPPGEFGLLLGCCGKVGNCPVSPYTRWCETAEEAARLWNGVPDPVHFGHQMGEPCTSACHNRPLEV